MNNKKLLQCFLFVNMICIGILLITNQYRLYSEDHYPFLQEFASIGLIVCYAGISLFIRDSLVKMISISAYILLCIFALLLCVFMEGKITCRWLCYLVPIWSITNIYVSLKYIKLLVGKDSTTSSIFRFIGLAIFILFCFTLMPQDKSFYHKFYVQQANLYLDIECKKVNAIYGKYRIYFKTSNEASTNNYVETTMTITSEESRIKLYLSKTDNKKIYVQCSCTENTKVKGNDFDIHLIPEDTIMGADVDCIHSGSYLRNIVSDDLNIVFLGTQK